MTASVDLIAPVDDIEGDELLVGEKDFPAPASGLRPILFQPTRRAADPTLRATIEQLIGHLEEVERRSGSRKRQRTLESRKGFHLAVEALACNALVVAMYGNEQLLAVPRANGAMWGSSAGAEPVYGQHFLDALTLLSHPEVGLTENVATGYSFGGRGGQLSTIRLTPRFLKILEGKGHGWPSLRRADPQLELLVFRDAKDEQGNAKELPYPNTTERKARRNDVRRLNAWLEQAPIFLIPSNGGPLRDRYDQPIDPTNRSLRRIFNNASWLQGGRLFGGFWQTMRREDRVRYLRIGTPQCPEGEPVVSVDYDQLFARIAYHHACAAQPEGDLYDIYGEGFSDDKAGRNHRKGIKRIFNALLFSSGELSHWPRDTAELFPQGTKLSTVREAIYAKHPALRGIFGTGHGFGLMHIESVILIYVLQSLKAQGVYALPIHDAVLVARSQVEMARMAMVEGVLQHGGLTLSVSISLH